MKDVIIWGTGQGGRMIASLLNADITVRAYCDSDEKKWGGMVEGIPVVPPEAVPELAPDAVFISMLNKDACAEVRARLEGMNVSARVVTAPELRQTFDLRLAALKMIAMEVRERVRSCRFGLPIYQNLWVFRRPWHSFPMDSTIAGAVVVI